MKPHGFFLIESVPPWTKVMPIMFCPGLRNWMIAILGGCSGGKCGRGTDNSIVYQYTRWYCSYRVLPNPFL